MASVWKRLEIRENKKKFQCGTQILLTEEINRRNIFSKRHSNKCPVAIEKYLIEDLRSSS
jgi:hypothetical protein